MKGDGSNASTSTDQGSGYAQANEVDGSAHFGGKDGVARMEYYFDFDSFKLAVADELHVKSHGAYLASHPSTKVRVEGHTDERGSREYNIALAERRANVVAQKLLEEGAARQQVAVVSYGKEKPAVNGHDENAWKWNRRAKIVYESDVG
jgi:peptidoglycan-associated lipoprotein